MDYLLGVDLGTTGCKAAVFEGDGTCLGQSYLEYGLITVAPAVIEQDPLEWWQLTLKALEIALGQAEIEREYVRGLSVSSQGISFVLLDAEGQPLGNAVNWLDKRAVEECRAILERYTEEELFSMTGKRVAPGYVLPKLLWFRRHQRPTWDQAKKVLMGHDYLLYQFCGETVTDHSMAGGTLLHDIHAMGWSADLLDAFGLSLHRLPVIQWSGTPVEMLRPEVGAQLGLPPQVVVSVGGQDQKCASLGGGIRGGVATVSLGTACAVTQTMRKPFVDPKMRIPTHCFVLPEQWELEGVVSTGAGSLRWYRDTVSPGTSYVALDEEAATVPRGSGGVHFFPHLNGAGSPHWDSGARGAFQGLSLATARAHLTRAVLEGVAYQIRENLTVTEELAGPVDEVMLFGGGAKSLLWREIIGDVVNRPVGWTSSVETATRGAAMLAGLGCGVFSDADEARRAMIGEITYREPDREGVSVYQNLYDEYLDRESSLLDSGSRSG